MDINGLLTLMSFKTNMTDLYRRKKLFLWPF